MGVKVVQNNAYMHRSLPVSLSPFLFERASGDKDGGTACGAGSEVEQGGELFQLLRGRRGVSVLRGTTCKTIDNTLVTLLPTGIRRWVAAVLPVIMWLLRSWALVQLPPKSVSVGFHRALKCRSSNRICATISCRSYLSLSLFLSPFHDPVVPPRIKRVRPSRATRYVAGPY